MRKAIYFDCFSGISGNMVLGALLHLGGDADYLWKELNKLKLSGYQLRIGKGQKQGIEGVSVIVEVDEAGNGQNHTHNHDGSHRYDQAHSHDHSQGHDHGPHRSHRDIIALIQKSGITDRAKDCALKIFQVIGQAEGKVHGLPSDDVTFHEVGAVDSIIDIVGTAVLLDYLKIDDVYCSPVKDGSGTIECAHGIIPVPVPAVMEMAGNSGITLLSDNEIKTELVTPTGFGILKGLNAKCGDIPQGRIEKIGYGFGTRETGRLNALRAALLTTDEDGVGDDADKLEFELEEAIIVMETNIDDMSSEVLGYAFDRLFEKGALDVFYTPIYMKKNRPAVKLSVICREKDRDLMAGVILKETSSFGIRFYPVGRIVLKRHFEQVHTPLGNVDVKVGQFGSLEKKAPEYESCAKLAEETNLSIREIYDLVNRYS